MEHTKLIALQNDLGLGHKGDIVLTTQKRVDSNQEPIAKDIIHRDFAVDFVRRWNAFEEGGMVDELRKACEETQKLFAFIAENYKSAPHFPSAERMVEAVLAKC